MHLTLPTIYHSNLDIWGVNYIKIILHHDIIQQSNFFHRFDINGSYVSLLCDIFLVYDLHHNIGSHCVFNINKTHKYVSIMCHSHESFRMKCIYKKCIIKECQMENFNGWFKRFSNTNNIWMQLLKFTIQPWIWSSQF